MEVLKHTKETENFLPPWDLPITSYFVHKGIPFVQWPKIKWFGYFNFVQYGYHFWHLGQIHFFSKISTLIFFFSANNLNYLTILGHCIDQYINMQKIFPSQLCLIFPKNLSMSSNASMEHDWKTKPACRFTAEPVQAQWHHNEHDWHWTLFSSSSSNSSGSRHGLEQRKQ